MLSLTLTLTLTLLLTTTLAQNAHLPYHPSSLTNTAPPTINVTYHQGLISTNDSSSPSREGQCDGMLMAHGNLTSGYCVGLKTYAISIERTPGVECAFRLFRGSAACGDDAGEMVSFLQIFPCITFEMEGGGCGLQVLMMVVLYSTTFRFRAERELFAF